MTRPSPAAVWLAALTFCVVFWVAVVAAFLWLPQHVAQGGLGFLAVLGALGAIGWGARDGH